jgi:hypothetical protein
MTIQQVAGMTRGPYDACLLASPRRHFRDAYAAQWMKVVMGLDLTKLLLCPEHAPVR